MLIALLITYLVRTGKLETCRQALQTVPYLGRLKVFSRK